MDAGKLRYPLELRKWKEEDFFYPFGMNNQSKKVSKFLKDEKVELSKKENVWVLCSENQIVWVVGMRFDERFRTTDTTSEILKIELL